MRAPDPPETPPDDTVLPFLRQHRMLLLAPAECLLCGRALAIGTEARYERITGTHQCLGCWPEEAPRAAGAIPARPRAGVIVLAYDDTSTATGGTTLAHRLDALSGELLRVTHRRRAGAASEPPAPLEHVVVTPSGVHVIHADTAASDRTTRRARSTARRQDPTPATRRRAVDVDRLLRRVDAVREAAGEHLPVRGVLCVTGLDWPFIGGSFRTRGLYALYPRRLSSLLRAGGSLSPHAVALLHDHLAARIGDASGIA